MNTAYHGEEPPVVIAADVVRSILKKKNIRLAFVGRAGAGKSTIASLISQGDYPIINHADTMKEEVLEWLTDALILGFDPESPESFEHFANFMGISSSRIQEDFWTFMGPVFTAFSKLYFQARKMGLPVMQFVGVPIGEKLSEKVAFVEKYKPIFRESLQLYGQMSKDIAACEEYWAERTVARSIAHPTCFNCDTRFRAEMEKLRYCGWSGIYLWIDDATQRFRRPEMTETERSHISEWAI